MMKLNTTLCVAALAMLAQAQGTIDDKFARARVAEVEQDLAHAAAIYTEITNSGASGPGLAKAWLRLSKVQRKLGRTDAAKVALDRAAVGEGEAAAEARRIKQGLAEGEAHVRNLIRQLQTGMGVERDLIWLGEASSAPLIELCDHPSADFNFVSRASHVLVEIGGDEVVRWIRRMAREYSPLKRRAVLRGTMALSGMLSAEMIDADVINALTVFTMDSDAAVLRDVVGSSEHRKLFSKQRVLALLDHSDPRVRSLSAMRLKNWRVLRGEHSIEMRTALVDRLRRPVAGVAGSTLAEVVAVALSPIDSVEAGELLLSALTLPFASNGFNDLGTRSFDMPAEVYAQRLLQTARVLGERPETGATKAQNEVSSCFVRAIKHWTRASMSVAFELIELGYARGQFRVCSSYLAAHATESDWPRIVRQVEKFAPIEWLERAPIPATADVFEPLRDLAVDIAARTTQKRRRQDLEAVTSALVRLGIAEALDWVSEFVSRDIWRIDDPKFEAMKVYLRVVKSLMRLTKAEEHLDPKVGRALRRVAVCEQRGEDIDKARHDILWYLTVFTDEQALSTWRTLVRHPDWSRIMDRAEVVLQNPNRKNVEYRARVAALWVQERPAMWGKVVDRLKSGGPAPDAIMLSLLDHSDTLPPELRLNFYKRVFKVKGEAIDRVVLRLLEDSDQELRAEAALQLRRRFEPDPALIEPIVGAVPTSDPQTVSYLTYFLGKIKDPRVVPELKRLLEHESGYVRATAINVLGERDSSMWSDSIMKLTNDQNPRVRRTLCSLAESSLNRRLVPFLIDCLRDEDLRAPATKALDAIRYYHDEKARWERILSGTDLGANTAAEALVKQARESSDRAVRLAAIESLGTLGVAETLPILISLMGDPDRELAAAASAAVAKINRSKPDKK